MFRIRSVVVATAYMLSIGAAEACIPPAPPVRLPNETIEAYKNRSEAVFRALNDEERRSFQVRLYDLSHRVSLAIVEETEPVDAAGLTGSQVVVRPVASLKGGFEQARVTLTDRYLTSCGPVGGGPATTARPGEYVVVFEGKLPDESAGTYGVPLEQVREPRLLTKVGEVSPKLAEAAKIKAEQR